MRKIIPLILSLTIIYSIVSAQDTGTEKLTNTSVINLHRAGLGKLLLISKIQSSACEFNLNTDKLIELKKNGVPDEVVEAMIKRGAAPASPVTTESNTSIGRLASGIYYASGTAYTELEPSVFSQTKQGAGILTSLTYGIAKTKAKATLSGERSNLRVADITPTFYFIFDKDSKGSLSRDNQTSWFPTASSPNEFVLVRLTVNAAKKYREVVTGSYNSYAGATAGIDDAQKVSFKYEKVSQGVYKVVFPEGIKKGEYCFMYAGSASSSGGSGVYKVFDFGVQ